MLKLNEEKIELIMFNPKHQVRMNEELRLQVGNNTVYVASSVKNLGVYCDTSLTMEMASVSSCASVKGGWVEFQCYLCLRDD